MNLSPAHCTILLNLARRTIRASLGEPDGPIDPPTDSLLLQPAGCFVSLHEHATNRLRGCVGRLDAQEPMYLAVTDSARSVLFDPRFENERIGIVDLGRLTLEISLLSPLTDAPDPLAFDPQVHGIYLTIGQRSGCFLPQVGRETGWSRQQLLERLCVEKIGMPPNAWELPDAKLQIFTAQILGPEAF